MKTSLIRLAFTSAFLAFLLWLAPQVSMAQNARNAPNTREYGAPQKANKRSKKDFNPNTTRAAKPKTAAQMRKEAREMKKPQYTDASYFGHKKPPKRRPVGKRKFCKECEIWH